MVEEEGKYRCDPETTCRMEAAVNPTNLHLWSSLGEQDPQESWRYFPQIYKSIRHMRRTPLAMKNLCSDFPLKDV